MDPIEKAKWLKSMDEEIRELTERQAFELIPQKDVICDGHTIIKLMWAFCQKRQGDGT